MRKALGICAVVLGALLVNAGAAPGPALPPPTVVAAKDGVLAAFKAHPIVGLGDYHGLAQEEDFYADLIRDPRFAQDVGNVVVEFGGAAHQDIIDRYVNGGDVPYAELRKVWTDVVGWIPTVKDVGLVNVFAAVRNRNLSLPPDKRIHIWLGEPPIDWSAVTTTADWQKYQRLRDSYPANIVVKEILAKGRKALVIYGTGHFYGPSSLKSIIEQHHPGTFFMISPYAGFVEKACSENFERAIKDWQVPGLALPIRRTTLETELRRSDCHFVPPGSVQFFGGPAMSEAQVAKAMEKENEMASGVTGDALLYLGPSASLLKSPMMPDIYLDPGYRREIDRRSRIMLGHPLSGHGVDANPVVQRPLRPRN
jgi:hypothetical protein